MDDKFCLKWNDFQENVQAAFSDLRGDLDYADVTLACEDHTIEAHKVILSACSPFFRGILKKNKHPHPLIYMRGLNPRDLTAVLDFIYHGEVNIAQEHLDGFLALAEEMHLKGLTGIKKEPENQDDTLFHQEYDATKVKKEVLDKHQTFQTARTEPSANETKHERQVVSMENKRKPVIAIDNETQMKIEAEMHKSDGRWNCNTCNFKSKEKCHLKEHVQTHMDLEFTCTLCGKIVRSANALRSHLNRNHPQTN